MSILQQKFTSENIALKYADSEVFVADVMCIKTRGLA